MNIYELNTIIAGLDPVKDSRLLDFYQRKRIELRAEIHQSIKQILKDAELHQYHGKGASI